MDVVDQTDAIRSLKQSSKIKTEVDTILKITKPCATVYIVNTKQEGEMLYETIKRNNPIEINALLIINEIKCIKPK